MQNTNPTTQLIEVVLAASNACAALNLYARTLKQSAFRDAIYESKRRWIQWLDEHQYTESIKFHKQEHTCSHCHGKGYLADGEGCTRCGGTGIFRTDSVYLFKFMVGGKSFRWHLPVNQITWQLSKYPKVDVDVAEWYQSTGNPKNRVNPNLDYPALLSRFQELIRASESDPAPANRDAIIDQDLHTAPGDKFVGVETALHILQGEELEKVRQKNADILAGIRNMVVPTDDETTKAE